MVYYYTSRNVKLIQSLMQDYRSLTETTPYEYIRACFESRLQNIEEQKALCIIDVFLGVYKHETFLRNIVREAGKLSDIEKDYFVIIAFGILFHISPKNALDIFKCMFNLSKLLLNIFVMFFSNKDNIAIISRIAQSQYDKYFVTENILDSILSWQPVIIEISKTHSEYNRYLHKAQTYYQKTSTSQIHRNIILNVAGKVRKNKGDNNFAPRFTTNIKFKVFMSSKIRHHKHERNKNVYGLRNTIKKTNYCYYLMEKPTMKNSKFEDICSKLTYRNNNSSTYTKETPMPKAKYTKCVVKRLNNVVKKCEQEELKCLQDIVDSCKNTYKVEKLLKQDQQEKEKQRLLKIKKNHLKGQISHEDAIIAKKNACHENKRKYNEFIKEKQLWEKEIEDWKIKQTEYNRKQVEKMSLIELNLINSRNSMFEKRQEMAETVRYDTKLLKELILKNKEADLERKIHIIKEIKTLSMFARNSRMQKTIDLNESPGFGFLCEMSVGELQKRLGAIKISLQEELDEKKNKIKTLNTQKKLELEETKKSNDIFLAERERLRNLKKSEIKTDVVSTDEISRLEKMLEKKRNKRILLTKQNC